MPFYNSRRDISIISKVMAVGVRIIIHDEEPSSSYQSIEDEVDVEQISGCVSFECKK
jgi:hypothetical protein